MGKLCKTGEERYRKLTYGVEEVSGHEDHVQRFVQTRAALDAFRCSDDDFRTRLQVSHVDFELRLEQHSFDPQLVTKN